MVSDRTIWLERKSKPFRTLTKNDILSCGKDDVITKEQRINVLTKYFTEFIFYSFLGWVWESIYCTVREKKWADRGFLFGPICPIYGSCAVLASVVFEYVPLDSNPDFPLWGIFLVCMIGSAIAEYSTSYILEKRFHARWWDYSKVPLNIRGRVCLPVSIAFGLAGIVVVKWLIPAVEGVQSGCPPLIYEILALLFAMLFGADYALTEAGLSELLKQMEEMHQEFNIRAESAYEKIASTPKAISSTLTEKKEELKEVLAEHKPSTAMAGDNDESLRVHLTNVAKKYAGTLNFVERKTLSRIEKFIPNRNDKEKSMTSYDERLRKELQLRARKSGGFDAL